MSSIRAYLDVMVPHFHICNGERPTASPESPPAFWQYEAWEVREMVLNHVVRVLLRTWADAARRENLPLDYGEQCACHAKVHRCADCTFVTFDLNEWATHLIGRPESCQPDPHDLP